MNPFIKKFLSHIPFFKTTNGLRDRSWLERIKTTSYHKWLIGIGTALLLTFLLSPTLQLPSKEYRVGDIAQKEIKSTQDLLVQDEKSTLEKRTEAERSIFSVYDYDTGVLTDAENRVRSTFESLANSFRKGESHPEPPPDRR